MVTFLKTPRFQNKECWGKGIGTSIWNTHTFGCFDLVFWRIPCSCLLRIDNCHTSINTSNILYVTYNLHPSVCHCNITLCPSVYRFTFPLYSHQTYAEHEYPNMFLQCSLQPLPILKTCHACHTCHLNKQKSVTKLLENDTYVLIGKFFFHQHSMFL